MIGKAFDNMIGIFSPESHLKRAQAREFLKNHRQNDGKRQYAAAQTPKSFSGWSPVDSDINSLIAGSSTIVRGRVRQLVRDFPYFTRALNVLTNYTVGSGIALQARVKRADVLDKKLNTSIEDGFKRWSDKADAAGRLNFFELTELAKRNECETGEYLFIKRHSKEPNRYIPFCLQAMEPDRLATFGVQLKKKTNIFDGGIEFDGILGTPLFYHFEASGFSSKPFCVPANDVIHGFKTLRPGQTRGISMFTPVVLLANDLSDFMGATQDRARLAAKWLAFVKTPNPTGFQQNRGVQKEGDKRIEDIDNVMIEYLNIGEEIEFANGSLPGEAFDMYVKLILHMIAVGVGVGYELLSGDYSGISYSTLRGKRNDLAKDIEPHQNAMIRHFCQPVYNDVLKDLVLYSKTDIPSANYNQDPWLFQKAVWMPPGTEAVDPLKESKANADQVKNLLRSPHEICRSRGRDIEDVLDELMEFKEMCEDRGLSPEETSSAIAQNPAVLGAGG